MTDYHATVFQSTLPLRGATVVIADNPHCCLISIHTPLAGSDFLSTVFNIRNYISIHTPLAGSDLFRKNCSPLSCNFNPHSPCGERLPRLNIIAPFHPISIHTPLAGSDIKSLKSLNVVAIFQSTLPLRGATLSLSTRSACSIFQSTLPLRGATWRVRSHSLQ